VVILSIQIVLEYKARLKGIVIEYTDPYYSSQKCSQRESFGVRKGKNFKSQCGHVDYAEVNAAFNSGKGQFNVDRDLLKWNADIPQTALSAAAFNRRTSQL
jgi:hypothetical protein